MTRASVTRSDIGWRMALGVSALAPGEATSQSDAASGPRPPRDELQAYPQAGPGWARGGIRRPAERVVFAPTDASTPGRERAGGAKAGHSAYSA